MFTTIVASMLGVGPALALYYNYDSGHGEFKVYNYTNGDWSFTHAEPQYPLRAPFSAIGRLDVAKTDPDNFTDWCTAWVISSTKGNLIATAGHCVADGLGHYYKNFLFTPGYRVNPKTKQTEKPWGEWSAEKLVTTPTFFKHGGRFPLPNLHDDFALLRLRPAADGTNIQERTGAFGWIFGASQRPIPFVTYDTVLSGYPKNVGGGESQQICHSAATDTEDFGSATSDGRESAFYHVGCDFTGGSSGGPFFTLHDGIALSVMSFSLEGDAEKNKAFMPWFGPYSYAIYQLITTKKDPLAVSDDRNESPPIVPIGNVQDDAPRTLDDNRRKTMQESKLIIDTPDPSTGVPRTAKYDAAGPTPPDPGLVMMPATPPTKPTPDSHENK